MNRHWLTKSMAMAITSCSVRNSYWTAYKSLKCGQNHSWTLSMEQGDISQPEKLLSASPRHNSNWSNSPTVNGINLPLRNRQNQSRSKWKFRTQKSESREKVSQKSNFRVTSWVDTGPGDRPRQNFARNLRRPLAPPVHFNLLLVISGHNILWL